MLPFPLPVAATELGVAKRPARLVKAFLPQQRQGDPFALELSVHVLKIHGRGGGLGRFPFPQQRLGLTVTHLRQLVVAQPFGRSPA
ncbi:hypothetical protein IQ254_17295 [Nodosilinea sp. LEGE 07088]|nr:hypothetical protein [Nodosilinea sp. LEGE 07088]